MIVAMAPLLISIYGKKKHSFLKGFLTGLIFYSLLLSWITELSITGHVKIFLYVGYIVLCFYLSVYTGLYAFFVSRAKKPFHFVLLSSFLWTAFEFIRSQTSQVGFPWGMTAYSLARIPLLIQIVSLGGVYLLVMWLAAVNSLAAMVFLKKKYASLPFALILLVNLVFGTLSMKNHEGEKDWILVCVIQPNVSQDLKGSEDEKARMRRTEIIMDFVSRSFNLFDGDIVIMPETSWPWPVKSICPVMFPNSEALSDSAKTYGKAVLVGAQDLVGFRDYYRPTNSVFLIDGRGSVIARHDKIYLVPFGEHLPFDDVFPFITSLNLGQSDYLPGKNELLPCIDGVCFGAGICYESAFEGYYRGLVEKGANFIVNVTDDQWFGRSAGPRQHADMFIFRAVENRMWGVRCANKGVSYIVDPQGRIIASTQPDTPDILFGRVGVRTARSPYTAVVSGKAGIFSVLCSFVYALVYLLKKRRFKCMKS